MEEAQSRLIEALYLELYERLYVYAHRCLGVPALAEEAVQDAFRIACQFPERLQDSPEPRGWIVMTLKNVIRTLWRRQRSQERAMEAHRTLHAAVAAEAPSQELMLLHGDTALDEDLVLLWGRVVEGRSHQELARERGITVECCRKRLQRAKARLQDRLGRY